MHGFGVRSTLLAAFLLTLGLLAIACGDDSDQQGQLSPTPEPSLLPDGFPVHTNATLSDSRTQDGQRLVTMLSPDAVADVAAFYKESLAVAPWLIVSQTDLTEPSTSLLSFVNSRQMDIRGTVFILRDSSDLGTIITITLLAPGDAPPESTPVFQPTLPPSPSP